MTEPTKFTVAVDFDGVLARYDGWKGVTHIGDPIPGAVEFMKELGKHYMVVIHTVRLSEFVNTPAEIERAERHITAWLRMYDFYYDHLWKGKGKPIAFAYIDDRAIYCEPGLGGMLAFDDVIARLAEWRRRERKL